MATRLHETPAPKLPPHGHKPAAPHNAEEKIDSQVEDTFPASDPPSYSGGRHAIGAPENRESGAAGPESPDVKSAEKKVKTGAATPDKY